MLSLFVVAAQAFAGYVEWTVFPWPPESAPPEVLAAAGRGAGWIVAKHAAFVFMILWCLDRYRDRRSVSVLFAATSIIVVAVSLALLP